MEEILGVDLCFPPVSTFLFVWDAPPPKLGNMEEVYKVPTK